MLPPKSKGFVSFEYIRQKLNFLNDFGYFPVYGILKADLGGMKKGEEVRLLKLWGSGFLITLKSDHKKPINQSSVVVSADKVAKYFERR